MNRAFLGRRWPRRQASGAQRVLQAVRASPASAASCRRRRRPSAKPGSARRKQTATRDARLPLVAAQVQAVGGECLLDLLDRLAAEVGDGRQLGFGLRDELADGLDPDPLEAVVRADAQLELLDGEVLHRMRYRDLRGLHGSRLAEALDLLEVGEDR